MDIEERRHYRKRASRITGFAHFFGILAIILLLVWLLHYREGIEYDSTNFFRVFNWLVGFFTYMAGIASESTRMRMSPWHISGGRALLYMSICAALTGLMEKYTFTRMNHLVKYGEGSLMNFAGLSILLFGVFVDLSVGLAHYV
ncbi:putative transmembrane ascorbate ferrireductase 3 [Senna tora]|uniref:Putative transmembrane ascorbate ferrireductase 3 n=1 Tax=Senna tora TaxID=362788 RepID=A0A834SPY7_9FABA|nr:putative transmembrane ascorbate ferrireductase 3 [Senna tora]